jgi:hypothetical protein
MQALQQLHAAKELDLIYASGGLPHVWEGAAAAETLIVKGKVVGTIMWFSPGSFDLKFFCEEPRGTKTVLD